MRVPLHPAGLAGVPDCWPALPTGGSFDSGDFVHPFGAAGRRMPVEYPGVEGAGQAGGTWVVSQKSKEKIADCRGSDQLLRGSLFLDRRNGGLYNCFIVSYC